MCINWSPQLTDVNVPLLKEQGMLHRGKHGPILKGNKIQDNLILLKK